MSELIKKDQLERSDQLFMSRVFLSLGIFSNRLKLKTKVRSNKKAFGQEKKQGAPEMEPLKVDIIYGQYPLDMDNCSSESFVTHSHIADTSKRLYYVSYKHK